MNYKELQKKAKVLGLKYVGIRKRELEKSIKEAEKKIKKEKVKKEIPARVGKIKETGQKAATTILEGIKKAADAYFIIIGTSAYFITETVAKESKKIENTIKIAKLKCSLPHFRKKIRELYTEIGGEVCVLNEQGLKDISIEKGALKKLINKIRGYEKEIKKLEDRLLKLQSEK